LNPTAANIDKEGVRWSFSWLPDGRCNSFTKGAILLFAPPTSGVYGLFNSDCQVFIGESENIQEALLRRKNETDFQPQHLQPTGFTFEPCTAELRKSKADELIAKFHPVLQTEAALTKTWSAPNDPRTSGAGLGGQEETCSDHQEFPSHKSEKQSKVRRHFYFKRTHGVVLTAMLVMSVILVFYLDTLSGKNIQKQAGEKPQERTSITQLPTGGQTEISLRPQKGSSIDTNGGIANQSAEPTPARKNWSVQVSAPPAKDSAETLLQRLKAKGYDGYVVQAEVKGQTYYRVRVGYFDSRENAESVRQSLTRQEGYPDAYITGD
jgi:hypothetical protein